MNKMQLTRRKPGFSCRESIKVVLGNNYGLIIDFFGEVCYNVVSLSSRCVLRRRRPLTTKSSQVSNEI